MDPEVWSGALIRYLQKIHNKLKGNHLSMSAYFTKIVNTYQNRFKIGLDVPLLGFEETKMLSYPQNDVYLTRKQLKFMKRFEEAESAGSEVSYRCVRCRGCPDCKRGERIDCISIQEEVEQTIIDKSVTVNLDQRCTSAKLPFLCDLTQTYAEQISSEKDDLRQSSEKIEPQP